MPIEQRLSVRPQAVCAAVGKPVETAEVRPVELHAVRDQLQPVLVIEAPAVAAVEQFAGDIGRVEHAGFLVLELVDAAAAATIAQGFPLAAIELAERLLPKWRASVHDKATLALLGGGDQAGISGLKSMRSLRFAIAAATMLALAAPAGAQMSVDSADFIAAVQKGDGGKAGQLLTDHPTIIDSRDGKGDTALIIAINRGDGDWTAFLLNKGADPNLASTKSGDTPLIAASRIGFEDAAEW